MSEPARVAGEYNEYKVSFVMPAYNEEGSIETAVRRALSALEKNSPQFEIIVVNDGSGDSTAAILRRLADAVPQLRIITHERNTGYGAALRAGFSSAKYPLIFYTDSDNQFAPEEISRLLPLSAEFDIVAGRRVRRKDPPARLLMSWVFNAMVRAVAGVRVHDVNCAFKLFRRELFDSIILESKDFFIDAEILARAAAAGFSITEVGVSHYPRAAGKPKVSPGNVMATLKELLRIRKSIKKAGGGNLRH